MTETPEASSAPELLSPRAGLPEVISDESGLRACLDNLLQGDGPIAIDAERASGYRYSQRAYLIQIFRRGGGLHLIDPVAIGESAVWREMSNHFSKEEWIIHASTQDLPCLREVGLEPQRLFDTELGGRIAGCEKVGLGPLTESLLNISLAKEHSAVDWSLRPLREEWLNYAALDVDILIDLRDAVAALLRDQGKLEWALQDFAAILEAPPAAPKKDPWRRTSGMHKIRDRQTLALIRDLWSARNEYAREIDVAPGRVFNDDSLMEVVTKRPTEINDFAYYLTRRSRLKGHPIERWFDVYRAALITPVEELPEMRLPSTTLPPIKVWAQKNPAGYARVTHARAAVAAIAQESGMATENLLSPELLRRISWEPPADIREALQVGGAREWQIALVTQALASAMLEKEPLIVAEPENPEEGAPE